MYFNLLQAPADGHLLDIVDNKWREEELPFDQILVPADKLPDPEADGGDSHLTLSEQVRRNYRGEDNEHITYVYL